MYDFCSIAPEKKWVFQHKACSIPDGILALAKNILRLAIIDIRNKNGREAAVTWIMNDDTNYQFSFLNCCALLQVDPEQIRRGVAAYLAGNHERKRRNRRKL